MTKPLDGLRVVDLTRVLAGPFATMMLADMGADVIKVENPKGGDDSRAFAPFKNGISAYYMGLNRSKRSVTLNLKTERGKEMLKDMVRQADVLVENFKPGTMEKLGLGYDVLRSINPRLIYAASSGFGQYGPYSPLPAYDLIVQGMSGFMSITGFDEEHPVKAGSSIADIFAGVFTVIGILSALHSREKTGWGQMVDVAMLDCMVAILENAIASYDCTGLSPKPIGNAHRSIAPFATFYTSDGMVNVSVGNNELWKRFCDTVGLETLAGDERFSENSERIANLKELSELVQAKMSGRTTAEWVDLLRGVNVPCGPINNVEQVLNDAHVLARDMVVKMRHPQAGELTVPGVPIKFSETPASIACPAPALGEHNDEVYKKMLGLSQAEIASLREEGVI